jgi:hypothetical protein
VAYRVVAGWESNDIIGATTQLAGGATAAGRAGRKFWL